MKKTTYKHTESTLVDFRESLKPIVLFISTDIRVVVTFASRKDYVSKLIGGSSEADS